MDRNKRNKKKKGDKRNKNLLKKAAIFSFAGVMLLAAAGFAFASALRYQKENSYAALVNGEPISVRELEHRMQADRSQVVQYFREKYNAEDNAGFWEKSYNGETPLDTLRKKALDECVKIKVQQILAQKKGIIKGISYSAFLKELDKENKRRAEAVKNNEVIYGPVKYAEDAYFEDVFAKMIITLKGELEGNEITFTDKDLQEYYETAKGKLFKNQDYIKIQKIYITYVDKDGNVNDTKRQEADIEIKQAKARLEKGGDFKKLAAEYNEEDAAKKNFGEQVLDDASARFVRLDNSRLMEETGKLAVGQVSDIFEANNTFYIIKCMEKHDNGYRPFIEVCDIVKSNYMDGKYDEYIEKLTKEAKVSINEKVYEHVKMGYASRRPI
jgi:PPIC-type PPIASE domain.